MEEEKVGTENGYEWGEGAGQLTKVKRDGERQETKERNGRGRR